MGEGWIYGAPPPPPPTQVRGNPRVSGRGRGAGRGRVSHRDDGKQPFRPAMQLDDLQHSTFEQSIRPANVAATVVPALAPEDGVAARPTQYNAEGYAISSTFNSSVHPNLHAVATSAHVPAPRIQGTNISLDTPEDIAAWIAERKKKWPTDANVEKNKATQATKPMKGPNKKRKMDQRNSRPAKRHQNATCTNHDAKNGVDATAQANTAQVPASSLDVALAALSGSIDSVDDQPDVIPPETVLPETRNQAEAGAEAESVAEEVPNSTTIVPDEKQDSSASGSESSDVSSDSESSDSSDDEDESPAIESSKAILPALTTTATESATPSSSMPIKSVVKRPCKYFRQGRCNHGESCTFSHAEFTGGGGGGSSSSKPRPMRPNQQVDDRYKWRKRKSLYDRLVESEVAQEKEAERLRLDAEARQESKELLALPSLSVRQVQIAARNLDNQENVLDQLKRTCIIGYI